MFVRSIGFKMSCHDICGGSSRISVVILFLAFLSNQHAVFSADDKLLKHLHYNKDSGYFDPDSSTAADFQQRFRRSLRPTRVEPRFEDKNGSVAIGEVGKSIRLDCNVFMLQDHTVSWSHIHRSQSASSLDLLTIGNSTYTLEPRIRASFRHPSNWGLQIDDLTPEDAGTYMCQISTFPIEQVRLVFLEIKGPIVKIVREQVVYNAGSHLEVLCLYRSSTKPSGTLQTDDALSDLKPEVSSVLRTIQAARRPIKAVPPDTIVWTHNGKRFSHRNRRRVRTSREMDGHLESVLSIKSAILEDSGNYSCIHAPTNHSDTIRISVVEGEHSAAIYKNSEGRQTVLASSNAPTLHLVTSPTTSFQKWFSLILFHAICTLRVNFG